MKALTRRQRQVLLLVAEGNTNAGIAARLAISAGTVNEILGAAYRSLGARDRTHAVALAIWSGEISLGELARIAAAAQGVDAPPEAVCARVSAELPARAVPSVRGAARPSGRRTAA